MEDDLDLEPQEVHRREIVRHLAGEARELFEQYKGEYPSPNAIFHSKEDPAKRVLIEYFENEEDYWGFNNVPMRPDGLIFPFFGVTFELSDEVTCSQGRVKVHSLVPNGTRWDVFNIFLLSEEGSSAKVEEVVEVKEGDNLFEEYERIGILLTEESRYVDVEGKEFEVIGETFRGVRNGEFTTRT